MWVAGVDSCRAGWYVVLWETELHQEKGYLVSAIAELVTLAEQPEVIGIDMVIGVPEVAEKGGRACDREARALLGWPRASSVFSPPCRAALVCESYAEAAAANRASGPAHIGLSKQAYNLFPKMREVDAFVRAHPQQRICEVHPELSFWMMNGQQAIPASKHTLEGQNQRRLVLEEQGFFDVVDACNRRPRGVKLDDVLDAYAVCWTAARLAAGGALRVPKPGAVDACGLDMAIWR